MSNGCCFAVNEEFVCGDGVCDGDESCWGCPNDCGLEANETGRAGASDRYLAVPAAVGGQSGVGGTFWLTEAMIYNASDKAAAFVFEFTPDSDPSTTVTAAPIELDSERALVFHNLVLDLFQTSANGSLRLDATEPMVLSTRTYNQTAEGTYGQAIGAAQRRLALGEGDGQVYLVGLSESTAFRSNLIVQEVAGSAARAQVTILRADGSSVGTVSLDVPPQSKVQRRLLDLGFGNLTHGFATVQTSGAGRLIAIGSVIDAITGDATTIDAIHPNQVLIGLSRSTEEAHFLVPVVAHTPGASGTIWRSELTVLNPGSTRQTVRLEYRPAPGLTHLASFDLAPGRSATFQDVVGELFPSAGDGTGALHVYAPDGVAVSSRTYNLLPSGGTLGQQIPGLGAGDLLQPGQTAVLTRLKSTSGYRCNVGFTEFSGADSEVTLRLVAVDSVSVRLLGEATCSVPAASNLQQNRLFEALGVSGEFDSVVAYVTITGGNGRVYAYGSNVDNFTGDAETLLAVIK